MGVRTVLARQELAWTSPALLALSERIKKTDWGEESWVKVVRCGVGRALADLVPVFLKEEFAIQRARFDVQEIRLESGDHSLDLTSRICEELGLRWDATYGSPAELISLRLRGRCPILICAAEQDAGAVHRQLKQLTELLDKAHGLRLVAFLLVSEEAADVVSDVDLSDIQPCEEILPILRLGERSRAREVYLHVRLAWEFGGHLGLAREAAFSVPPDWDDKTLEERLDRMSEHVADRFDKQQLEAVLSWVNPARRGVSSTPVVPRGATGLLWRPNGAARICPYPWLARLAFNRQVGQSYTKAWRSYFACLPIVREVWSQVYRMEWVASARLIEDLTRRQPPGARPSQASEWDRLALGEIIEESKPHRPTPYHQLRVLRNRVVHGEAVGWSDLEEILRLETEF